MRKLGLALLLFSQSIGAQNVPISDQLIKRLKNTQAINMDEVIEELKLTPNFKRGYSKISDPFNPKTILPVEQAVIPDPINGQTAYTKLKGNRVSFNHQPVIYNWYYLKPREEREAEVCGIKFVDNDQKKYRMQTFASREMAESEGYLVTHQFHCGACSSLYDLGIYLEKRNMVENGRKCAKKLIAKRSKSCHIKRIGLSEVCAEAWAYNAIATRKNCMRTCIKEYGLINMLLNRFPDVYVNEDGSLKPCILCDELKSGGGYRYSSGRTRRSSGIKSAIDRGEEEIFPIDFKTYYQVFNLDY